MLQFQVISKTVIPAIKVFWERWPTEQSFNPEEMLQFLYKLLENEALPDDERVNGVKLLPVPLIGEKKYAPAYKSYAPKEWTGNEELELIYGSLSCILIF